MTKAREVEVAFWELYQEFGEQDLQQETGEEEPGSVGAGVQEEQETEDRAVRRHKLDQSGNNASQLGKLGKILIRRQEKLQLLKDIVKTITNR